MECYISGCNMDSRSVLHFITSRERAGGKAPDVFIP